VQPLDPVNHLSFTLDQIAGLAVCNQFGHRTASVSEHRSSGGHGFDHHHAERLVPMNRKEKSFSLAHQSHQIAVREALDVADLIAVDKRLYFLEKIFLAPRKV